MDFSLLFPLLFRFLGEVLGGGFRGRFWLGGGGHLRLLVLGARFWIRSPLWVDR